MLYNQPINANQLLGKSKIIKALEVIDVFGQPVQLYINGKTLHKTATGGIITIFMIATLLILFLVSFINLIYKKNVTTQDQTSYEISPPLLDINKDNFMFSFGLSDPTITQNNSIISYQLKLVTEIKGEGDEKVIIKEESINFGLCTPNDYTKFVDNKKVNILTRTFCPQNFSFPIQGDTNDDIYQYISLTLVKCENETHKNISCASEEAITQYFQNTPMVKFDLYFLNGAIDPYDIEDPYKEFIEKETWTLSPLGSMTRISTISFRSLSIYTYDNIFGIDSSTIWKAIEYLQDRTDLSFIPLKNTNTYFNFYLTSSNYKKTFYRTYGTILQILSFIGGIFNLMHIFLGVIASKISNHIFEIMMANRLYNFDVSDIYEHENKPNKTIDMKEEPLSGFNENDQSYWKATIRKKFEKLQLLRAPLIYPTMEYIKNSIWCLATNITKKKNNLFKIANNKIINDMDISVIMRKLKEIEKLKQILLTREQLSIFNFMPPPAIETKKSKHFFRKKSSSKFKDDDDDISTIINSSDATHLCDDLAQYYKYSPIYIKLKKVSNTINDNMLAYLSLDIQDILDSIEKSKRLEENLQERDNNILLQPSKLDVSLNIDSNSKIPENI